MAGDPTKFSHLGEMVGYHFNHAARSSFMFAYMDGPGFWVLLALGYGKINLRRGMSAWLGLAGSSSATETIFLDAFPFLIPSKQKICFSTSHLTWQFPSFTSSFFFRICIFSLSGPPHSVLGNDTPKPFCSFWGKIFSRRLQSIVPKLA